MKKMKKAIVINTCIAGSTGKIARGLHKYLNENGVETFFAYGREDGLHDDNYYRIDSKIEFYVHVLIARFLGLPGYGSRFATRRLAKFISEQNIDTCFVISPHGYYLNEADFYHFLSTQDIRVVYVMIDEYAFLGRCGYSNQCEGYLTGCKKCNYISEYPRSFFFDNASRIYDMKKFAYENLKRVVFVGPKYTVIRAKISPLLENKKIEILDEAIDTSFYAPRSTYELRKELGIRDEQIVLLCVAPYSIERKGCKYFLQLAEQFVNDDKYVFVHVGFNVDKISVPINYIKIGFLSDQEKLAQFYSLGDLFVFPSLLDTMPNACLEALSCGTPLLCFNVSGMPYIADSTVATFVEPKNVAAMKLVVESLTHKTPETISKCREYALSRYNNTEYFLKLKNIAETI